MILLDLLISSLQQALMPAKYSAHLRILAIQEVQTFQKSLSGNNVYVIWIEFLPFNDEIFFAVSPDKGQTFSEPLNLSQTPGISSTPQIATP
jgi:hypothetical protein